MMLTSFPEEEDKDWREEETEEAPEEAEGIDGSTTSPE